MDNDTRPPKGSTQLSSGGRFKLTIPVSTPPARTFTAEDVERAARAMCWRHNGAFEACYKACIEADRCEREPQQRFAKDARAALSAVGRVE